MTSNGRRRTRRTRWGWGASLLLALGLLGMATTGSAATLKIAAIVPDGTTWMVAMRAGAEEIKRRTDGRVKIKFYPGGVMGDAKSVLRKMRVGQLHGGAFTVGGLKGVYADAEVYSLPFLFRSYAEVDHVRKQIDPVLRQGFERAGLIALTISEGGFAHLMSQRPVHQVADLAGGKVWAQEDDAMSRVAWEIAGVSPVTLPLADVFTALQTGMLDTVASSPVAAIAFQWHTRLGYVTDVPLSYITGVLAVDRRAFEKLTPSDRALVVEVLDRISGELDAATRQSDRQAREALRNQGLEFIVPTPSEIDRWRQIADATIARLSARGEYSPELIARVESLLQTYRETDGAEPWPANGSP